MVQAQQQMPLTTTADANGDASVTLPPLVGNSQIIVGIVNVQTDGDACIASVLLNGLPVCQTGSGNMDTAAGDPPLTVGTKDELSVQWNGCAQGDTCQAVFYYTNPPESGQGIRSQRPTSLWQGY